MRYLYSTAGRPKRRVMHIARHTPTGEALFEPLCGRVHLPFDRTINVPLGLRICRWCRERVA